MFSEEKQIILRVVEHFARTGSASDKEFKVTSLPANKTSIVEQVGDDGRSVMLDEYRVDGKVIWAAFSVRTGTVYLSPAGAG
ncbi:MAG: hypothetical protein HY781_12590 [Chloroflexi bacterium]|nr:hypothetical protein [Chloroflexota bacterium]